MAAGKAVVSTTIGAEGLPVQHGENILLADDAETLARSVADLLGDAVRRKNMGAAARKLVSENYSWKAVGKTMAKVLVGVAEEHAPVVREVVVP
jgi:glycosyltransferase involved in cell wall biosynthesis